MKRPCFIQSFNQKKQFSLAPIVALCVGAAGCFRLFGALFSPTDPYAKAVLKPRKVSTWELLQKEQAAFCQRFLANDTESSSNDTTILPPSTKVTVKGVDNSSFDMLVYSNKDFVSDQILSSGFWDPGKLKILVAAMETYSKEFNIPLRNLTFVDIGANIGWFTLQLATLGVNVISVEPFPANVQMMRQTLCWNPHLAERIGIFPISLSSNNHTCVLFSEDNNVGDGNLDCNSPDPYNFVPPVNYHVQAIIPCRRVDDLLFSEDHDFYPDHQPLQIAAVKVDVEAHEPHVVLGGPRFFAKYNIPFFILEFIPSVIKDRNGDAVGMMRTFCDAGCIVGPEMKQPWNCTNQGVDQASWAGIGITDLIIECPIEGHINMNLSSLHLREPH